MVSTYFNPDEYWQGPEVAHYMVFGYGHLTWEWKQRAQLRGVAHTLFFAVPFKLLAVLGMDSPTLIAYTPRVVQGVIAGVGDYYTHRLGLKLFGPKAASWTLFCSIFSWFHFFCSVRTFSNSIESVLTVISLCHWPMLNGNRPAEYANALLFAGLAVVVRPTSAVVWVFVGVVDLMTTMDTWAKRWSLCATLVMPMVIITLGISVVLDRWFYGEWTCVLYNFLEFNVFKGLDKLYGTHPWYWYFLEGFTTVLGVYTPFLIFGFKEAWRVPTAPCRTRALGWTIMWALVVYSFGGHKEFRFVLPLLPMALVYCGYTMHLLHTKQSLLAWGQRSVFAIVGVNVIMAGYLSFAHQRSPVTVMNYLRNEAADPNTARPVGSIHFLMPCHSTPYYSQLHQNIPMWFIDCSPPFMVEPPSARRELQQVKYFEQSPLDFVQDLYSDVGNEGLKLDLSSTEVMGRSPGVWVTWKHAELPTHIVTFDSFESSLAPFFQRHGYTEQARFFHSHVQGDVDATEHHGSASVWSRGTSTKRSK